jgi:hypothetical protein
MTKKILGLKSWVIVKDKPHNLDTLREQDPSNYLYQLNNGVYYPAVRLSDIPEDWNTELCYKE